MCITCCCGVPGCWIGAPVAAASAAASWSPVMGTFTMGWRAGPGMSSSSDIWSREKLAKNERKGKGACFVVQISPYTVSVDITFITLHVLKLNSFTVSSPWGKCSEIFCSCSHSQYQFSFHLIPIPVGWTVAVWIKSMPKAFTHDQCYGN